MIQGDQKVQAENAMDAQKGFGFSSALQSLLSELSKLIGWKVTQDTLLKDRQRWLVSIQPMGVQIPSLPPPYIWLQGKCFPLTQDAFESP